MTNNKDWELVKVEYFDSKRVFVFEDTNLGGFFIQPEDGRVINPFAPLPNIPSKEEIENLIRFQSRSGFS